jgi:hypothetical protein
MPVPGLGLRPRREISSAGRGQFVRNRAGEVAHFVYFEFGKRLGKAIKVKAKAS